MRFGGATVSVVFLVAVALLPACVFVSDCPDCHAPFTCDEVAIRDSQGNPDACDVAACESCVGACGSDCAILETYPPRYACSDESWDVYDTCPTWTGSVPSAAEIESRGCGIDGGESLTATSTVAGRIEVEHIDAVTGCCPDSMRVGVTAVDTILSLTYEPVNDMCDCACELDVAYAIVDVPSGTWTLVASPSGASVNVTVP